jgi:hypothetical protein
MTVYGIKILAPGSVTWATEGDKREFFHTCEEAEVAAKHWRSLVSAEAEVVVQQFVIDDTRWAE